MESKSSIPYLKILVAQDQEEYFKLRSEVGSEKHRYQRFRRVDTFDSILLEIKKYCIRHDNDDWKRCLVCGICWLSGCLAVNVKQLSLLIQKSKSNINGVFSKLGYITDNKQANLRRDLIETLPILRGNHIEQKFWTIRVNPSMTPAPSVKAKFEEAYLSSTPQPTNREEFSIPGSDAMLNLFDVLDVKIKPGIECGSNCDDFDFYADTACCFPAQFFYPQTATDAFFSFA